MRKLFLTALLSVTPLTALADPVCDLIAEKTSAIMDLRQLGIDKRAVLLAMTGAEAATYKPVVEAAYAVPMVDERLMGNVSYDFGMKFYDACMIEMRGY